jgi:ABC-type amino acid transport system permease subunit
MAQSVTSLRRTSLVAIGGIADLNGRVASARSAEFDPRRTYCELAPLITLVFFFMTTDERFRGV